MVNVIANLLGGGVFIQKMNELKRCPFCGELAEVIRIPYCPDDIKSKTWVVGCDGKYGCLCPGYIYKCTPFYVTREQAVEYWNHRPPISVADKI